MAAKTTTRETSQSRQSSPDEPVNSSSTSLFEFSQVPQIQVVKPSFSLSDDILFNLGMLNGNQQPQTVVPSALQFVGAQQYMLQNPKDETLELEDYVQGLTDRFELPSHQLMTPRRSFEQGTVCPNQPSPTSRNFPRAFLASLAICGTALVATDC
jgi:hypothetical protein